MNMNDPYKIPQAKITQHELKAKHFRLANIVERIEYVPECRERMHIELRACVYTKVVPVVHKSFPKTWWDAFKLRWFPTWLLRRYPAELETIHVDVHEMYPTVPSIGEHRAVLTLVTTELPRL